MTDTKQTPIEWAVATAWQGANSNEEACDNLLGLMKKDPELYRLIMEKPERQAAMERVCAHKRSERALIWDRPTEPDRRVQILARINRLSLLDMRLPSGKRLGDATRVEVIAAQVQYEKLAKGNAEKAGFLSRVAAHMPTSGTVQDAMSASEIEDLR